MDKAIHRAYNTSKLTTRSDENGGKYIEGYFVVFNQETELWDGVFEKVDPHALDDSVRNNDIRCLFNHDTGAVLGRCVSGTCRLSVDDYGLYGSVRVNESDSMARDVYARVERGDISGCSYGYIPLEEDYTVEGNEVHWTVEKADVQEISVCTFPAYPQTDVKARKEQTDVVIRNITEAKKAKLKERIDKIWD